MMQTWGFLNLRGTADEEGSIDLAEDQLLIGRTSKCKIRYADTTVSSVHAKLSFARETGEVWLEDCSVNGTWLGARRIGKGKVVRLHDGDIFSLLRSDSGSTPPQYSYSIELLARSGSAAPRPAPNDEEDVFSQSLPPRAYSAGGGTPRQPAVAAATATAAGAAAASPSAAGDYYSTPEEVAAAVAAAVDAAERAAQERMVLAVQTAVADANRHSERVRQQAVEAAAESATARSTALHAAALSEARRAGEAGKAEAVAAAEEASRRASSAAVEEAASLAREAAAAEQEPRRNPFPR